VAKQLKPLRFRVLQASCAESGSWKPEKRARYRVAPSRTTFSVKGEAPASARPERDLASSRISLALPSSSVAPSWMTQAETVAGRVTIGSRRGRGWGWGCGGSTEATIVISGSRVSIFGAGADGDAKVAEPWTGAYA